LIALTYANDQPQPESKGSPPEVAVAVMVDGPKFEIHRFGERMVTVTHRSALPPGVKVQVTSGTVEPQVTTKVVPVVEETIAQFHAADVVARRVDGREISLETLRNELSKPSPVLWLKNGQRLSPFFAKLFKPDSIVLFVPEISSETKTGR
jgi:hypothetical protein